jgi:ribulose-phosphate 3-epimerase
MTVHPGFGGPRMIAACLDKVRQLSRTLAGRELLRPLIAVDGGVHAGTVPEVVHAGADVAIVGSGIFNARGSVASNLAELRVAIAEAETEGERR